MAHRNISDWQPGSRWQLQRLDGFQIADIAGIVVSSAPPTRLVLTWASPVDGTPVASAGRAQADEARPRGPSRVTFAIESHGRIVRRIVTHENVADEAARCARADAWAAVLSNLKSFLATGRPLPQAPWEMLPGFVRT